MSRISIRLLALLLLVIGIVIISIAIFLHRSRTTFTYSIDTRIRPSVPQLPGLRGRPSRPVGVMIGPGPTRDEFVLNEVIVHPSSNTDLVGFLTRYNGTILSDGTPMIIPGGGAKLTTPPPSAGWLLVRVDLGRVSLDRFSHDMKAAGVHGRFRFSSQSAVKIMALVAKERKRDVGLNLLQSANCRVCEEPTSSGGNLDPTTWKWMTEDDDPMTPGDQGLSIGVIHAQDFLNYMGVPPPPPGGIWHPTILAIIDGGFALDPDTGAPLDGNRDYFFPPYNMPLQADVVDHDLRAGGRNLSKCSGDSDCPYHGQGVFGVAAAYPNNLFGGAGTGGAVVRPMLIRVDDSWYTDSLAIRNAVFSGAQVINISSGGDCNWFCRHSDELSAGFYDAGYDDLENAVNLARGLDSVVVASAGNGDEDGVGIDISDEDFVSCKLEGVLCVGAIDLNGRAQGYSNYGRGVDIWAPADVFSTVDPNTSSKTCGGDSRCDRLVVFSGTSAAAPFVAGIVGLMKTLNPSLHFAAVQKILQDTANKDSDPKVIPGYVDAYRAVTQLKRNEPPIVLIKSLTNGETLSWGRGPGLEAEVKDPEQPRAESRSFQVSWSSSRDGHLCDGAECLPPRYSLGTHIITATATDAFGAVASDSVVIDVVNSPPVIKIDAPQDGSSHTTGQMIRFVGSALDTDEFIPEASLVWSSSLDGPFGVGHDIRRSLSAGTHQVTLTAWDSFGVTVSDSVILHVRAGSQFPTARIVSAPTQVGPGLLVTLQGTGTDPEDGALPNSRLRWFSSIDGFLGTGRVIRVVLSGPSMPCNPESVLHQITLQVRDSDGHQDSDRVTVSVGRVC
jgi:Subtilase family